MESLKELGGLNRFPSGTFEAVFMLKTKGQLLCVYFRFSFLPFLLCRCFVEGMI